MVNSPLMVRMLLVVHLSDRKLPQHRAELYQRFTETILHSDHAFDEEVAEELRKLAGNSPELLRTLAFGMHRRGEQQGREIDDETLHTLLKPDFAVELDAFVILTRLRGTLIEERDGFYRFLHLAFQEYLADCYLVDDYGIDEGFAAIVRFFTDGEILNSWWHEVALLVPGYLSMGRRRQAYRFIRMLAGLDEWQTQAVEWSPDVQWAALEIATTAMLEWMPEDDELGSQIAQRLLEFSTTPHGNPQPRLLAGRKLSDLGDPRFRSDAWLLPNDPMLGFIEMPAGTFVMGEGKEEHKVTISEFYIARWPVTVGQFRIFVEATGANLRYDNSLQDPDNHPIRWLTWHEATRYCAWLTEVLHKWEGTPEPFAKKLRQGWKIMLPSEAEWERAARGLVSPLTGSGGMKARIGEPVEPRLYPWGNEDINPNRANYDATGIGDTSAVGCFPAGATPDGVEELSGNVWEWTRSLYAKYPYSSNETVRREWEWEWEKFIAEDEEDWFMLRGGAYYGGIQNMRAPFRAYDRASDVNGDFGCRLAFNVASGS